MAHRYFLAPLATVALLLTVMFGVTGCKDCGPAPAPHTFGAPALYTPTVSQAQPVWYIDPQNVTGCANTPGFSANPAWGTSPTCTGTNGPLTSWNDLNSTLWGCGGSGAAVGCPRLRQNTTVTFLSSHTNNADPVYFRPAIENGSYVILQGALPTPVATGTALAVTAKNRATPTLLKSTFTLLAPDAGPPPTLLAGEMIINSTHPSRNWIYTVGSPNVLTTPLTAEIPTNPAVTPAEVTTWANSDVVNIYAPLNINIAEVSPTFVDENQTNFNNQLVVYNLTAFDPAAADVLTVGGNGLVQFLEVAFQRNVVVVPGATTVLPLLARNCFFTQNLNIETGAGPQFGSVNIYGGAFTGGFVTNIVGNLDADIVIGSTSVTTSNGNLGTVYVDTGKTLKVGGTVGSSSNYNASTPVIWGPGTVNVVGMGRLGYPSGAGKAATTLTATTLQLNGQTKYLTVLTSSATGIVTGNTTLTAAALDASFGATSGCALGFGAAICNVGP